MPETLRKKLWLFLHMHLLFLSYKCGKCICKNGHSRPWQVLPFLMAFFSQWIPDYHGGILKPNGVQAYRLLSALVFLKCNSIYLADDDLED